MKSVQAAVLSRVRKQRPGAIFVPADFLDLGSRAAVDQALSRLVRANVIRRLSRGVYDRPKRHPRLGALSPSLPKVAAAMARSTGSRIQVHGARAANQLGLSAQVPAQLVYLTDGATRTVRVGRRAIGFRHASPRALVGAGTTAGLVLQALRHLGPDGISSDVVATLRSKLRDRDRAALKKYVRHAPAWMRPALKAIAQEEQDAALTVTNA